MKAILKLKILLLLILSGGLFILSFPPFSNGAFIFMAFTPSLYSRLVLSENKVQRAFSTSVPHFIWTSFFVPGIWDELLWVRFAPLLIGLCLFLIEYLNPIPLKLTKWFPIIFSAKILTFEYFKSQTPLGLVGSFSMTAWDNSLMLKVFPYGGIWTILFLITFCNAILVLILVKSRFTKYYLPIGFVLFSPFFFLKDKKIKEYKSDSLNVAGVQLGWPEPQSAENVPAKHRRLRNFLSDTNFENSSNIYLKILTNKTREIKNLDTLDLIIWPEGIFQIDILKNKANFIRLQSFVRKYKFNLLFSYFSPFYRWENYTVKASMMDPLGNVSLTQRKIRDSLISGSTGDKKNINIGHLMLRSGTKIPYGVLICYDLNFLNRARDLVRKGARVLFVPSDDSNQSTGAWYYTIAVLQAAQLGVPILKTDTAFGSVFINNRGRILNQSLILNKEESVIRNFKFQIPFLTKNFYIKYGDIVAYLFVALYLLITSIVFQKNYKSNGPLYSYFSK